MVLLKAQRGAALVSLGAGRQTEMTGATTLFSISLLLALVAQVPLAAAQRGDTARAPVLKHVPLGAGGAAWMGLAAQSRTRVESWRNFAFGTPTNHDADYVLQRFLVSADLHMGRRVRVYLEAKSAVLTDRDLPGGRRSADADDLDLQNAYVEVTFAPAQGWSVGGRTGRQELSFGKQRLLSPLDWANTRRTFEAVRGTVSGHDWTIDAFVGHPVRVLKAQFNRWDGAVDVGGVYAQRKGTRPRLLELYWLALARDAAAFNGTSGKETRHTVGARVSHQPGRLVDVDAEVAYQFGSVGSAGVSAGMVSVDIAIVPPRARSAPRIHAGVDFASGDGTAGGDVGTFNQLFPLGHAFLGFIDVVGRQNVVAANAGLDVGSLGGVRGDVTLHWFRRASGADALYNAGGGIVRAAGTAASQDVGSELDVTARRRFGRYVAVLVGYSVFFPGDFIRQTGMASNTRFVYGSLQLTY